MDSFSVWEFNEVKQLETAQKKISDNKNISEEIKWDDEPLNMEIKQTSDGDDFSEIKTLNINNETIKYISFAVSVDKAKNVMSTEKWYLPNGDLRPRSERVRTINSDTILFEKDSKMYGIFFSGVTIAKQIISKLFPKTSWGKISKLQLGIDDDMLFWMFKSFIDFESRQLSDNVPISITAIRSYLAKTRDTLNTLRGKGEKISAILGTLAFLFNNDKLKSISPELQYNGEVIVTEISLNGTYKLDQSQYDGQFISLEKNEKRNAIVIYLIIVLLPKLVEAYRENRNNGGWSMELKVDFIKRLGVMIKENVDSELERMKTYGYNEKINFIDEIETQDSSDNLDDELEQFEKDLEELDE
ncbi:hypothetical protein ACYUJ6_02150 [Clostridium sp. JNZ X4-2]